MEKRIRFKKGMQREFLDIVIDRLGCVSLRGILQFGFDYSYACLKSYYIERRMISKVFFDNLGYLAKLDPKKFDVEYIDSNWGQIKGGKVGKRFKSK